MLYFVTSLAAGPAMREALGRAYASTNEQPYPIPAYYANGQPNLDPSSWTYWYTDPRLSADSTQYAFSYDPGDFPGGLSGEQIIATGFGAVTLPDPETLTAEWFPPPPPPPAGPPSEPPPGG
jgi:hypothetical protein